MTAVSGDITLDINWDTSCTRRVCGHWTRCLGMNREIKRVTSDKWLLQIVRRHVPCNGSPYLCRASIDIPDYEVCSEPGQQTGPDMCRGGGGQVGFFNFDNNFMTFMLNVHNIQKRHLYYKTSTSNPFLCAADFFLQLGSCKEAVR